MSIDEKWFVGIDVGTTTTKAVIVDASRTIVGRHVRRSGADLTAAARAALAQAARQAGVEVELLRATGAMPIPAVATGFGRRSVPFAGATRTEIGCHARGCRHYYAGALTIVDVGGQDSKIIKLDDQGRQAGFKMNRKCAAGTGSFLEEIARKLDLPLADLNGLAEAAPSTARIGSYCTVFSATEVLDRIREGERVDAIIRGLFDSVARRILEMDTLTGRVVMTGGVVAHNPVVATLLGERAHVRVEIAPHPQEMGAFGAACLALDSAL
jgi:predicted CoA-substrate-specific enzyme activase